MNYQAHYDSLIERARQRVVQAKYVEKHHVVPRCLGGSDDKNNIVPLTPEEHFVAHQLLIKLNPGNYKLAFAARMMTVGNNRNNKLYGWLRRKNAEASSALPRTKEQMEACHAGRRNKGTSEQHRKRLAEALSGRVKSDAHKKAMSIARKNLDYTPELREKLAANKGKKLNELQFKAFVLANKGKQLSEEHKKKLRKPKGDQIQVTCPHCGKQGGVSLMKRWHFDNCKEKNHGTTH